MLTLVRHLVTFAPMRLKSLDQLDLEQSWTRVLTWARGDVMDVPDRLPYEIADRVWLGTPEFEHDHEIQPVQLVMATKVGKQTVRPFVRPHVRDMLLYQALVDSMRDDLEAALPARDVLFSYRLASLDNNDAFEDSPTWNDFQDAFLCGVELHPASYVLRGDLSSFFLTVQLDQLRIDLLEIGVSAAVVHDLFALLTGWQHQGVRGLPQGLPPSGPLGNLYLRDLDGHLKDSSTVYWRYSDDFVAVTEGFGAARTLLDSLERALYERGLSLGAAKTSIRRAETFLADLTDPGEEVDEALQSLIDAAGDYGPSDDEVDEARLALLRELFDSSLELLKNDSYPRHEFVTALRGLGRGGDDHAVKEVPYVMTRMPGLTAECMRYLTSMPGSAADDVAGALATVIKPKFHRDQEWVHILRAALHVPGRRLQSETDVLSSLALEHDAPLVRARAVLAWGKHAKSADISTAEAYFRRERRMWHIYAVASLRGRSPKKREDLYEKWSSEGHTINRAISSLKEDPLKWEDM